MGQTAPEQIVAGLWQVEVPHPEWTEDEGGEEGWEQVVRWWAVRSAQGVVLVDPLIELWDSIDRLLVANGGCAGIVRTIHWHQRSVAEAAARYRAGVWARAPANDSQPRPYDHDLGDGDELFGALRAIDVERADEIALWLPGQSALLFGDAMLRRSAGELRICPDSWTQPKGGSARLRELLRPLTELPVQHVLVSHGPHVLGDGLEALRAAIA
jgi:glyoxylase-like metal-dependent hydrolase (beta-lactamase superfamily II)